MPRAAIRLITFETIQQIHQAPTKGGVPPATLREALLCSLRRHNSDVTWMERTILRKGMNQYPTDQAGV